MNETAKTEAPCHNKCDTIKIYPCSNGHKCYFAANVDVSIWIFQKWVWHLITNNLQWHSVTQKRRICSTLYLWWSFLRHNSFDMHKFCISVHVWDILHKSMCVISLSWSITSIISFGKSRNFFALSILLINNIKSRTRCKLGHDNKMIQVTISCDMHTSILSYFSADFPSVFLFR